VDKKPLLYCASQSQARHELLRHAGIPFTVIPITVNEEDAEVSGTVQEQVLQLAQYKHIGIDVPKLILAHEESKAPIFLLTADTLIAGIDDGVIYGKPRDRDHAREMVGRIAQQNIVVATGMCLSIWQYHPEEEGFYCPVFETWVADAQVTFSVPESEIETYLDRVPCALKGCGATVIDGIGIVYFKSINGSYTGTLGLDMYGLYERLRKYRFFI
jgi:septum formation protein